jgi:hypothetical protein
VDSEQKNDESQPTQKVTLGYPIGLLWDEIKWKQKEILTL